MADPNTGLELDVLDWLNRERDRVVAERAKVEAEYVEATMSMAPPDDGTSRYLFAVITEIGKNRERMALFQRALQGRVIVALEDSEGKIRKVLNLYAELRKQIVERGLSAGETLRPYVEALDAAVDEVCLK